MRLLIEASLPLTDSIAFDDTRLRYENSVFCQEIKWDYFVAYAEEADILYLFPVGSIDLCNSFSAQEIGSDNLQRMKDIVKAKMPVLKP